MCYKMYFESWPMNQMLFKESYLYMVHTDKAIHGLFLADFIAVIRLYSQCQKVYFFPNFRRKIPNFKS